MAPTKREVERLLNQAKSLAKRYRALTGKPLGITGEVAEFYASKYLGLRLAPAREPGYDATVKEGKKTIRIQIKGRCIPKNAKPGQRLGAIKLEKNWDRVILVLMDEDFEIKEMFKAERPKIAQALKEPGSKARNERGALGVNKFKAIGESIWKAKAHPTMPSSGRGKRRRAA
jgi:hypothetical protein